MGRGRGGPRITSGMARTRSEALKAKADADAKDTAYDPVRAEAQRALIDRAHGEAPPAAPVDDFLGGGAPEPRARPSSSGRGVRLPEDFERIVESVFEVGDAKELFDRLKACLVVGEGKSDRGSLRSALDQAERHAQEAHQLYASACLERKRLKHAAEIVSAGMRDSALSELHDEKADGKRTKQITDADVTSRVASKFPDEWTANEEALAKAALTEEHLKELCDSWRSKCASLRTMLETLR